MNMKLQTVRLVTRGGELITEVKVPPRRPPPDILMWSDRMFVRQDESTYREGNMWLVPPERRG